MEATKITRNELAANLAEIMERVIANREHFFVVEGDVVVAELRPGPKRFTVDDFRREFGDEFVPKGLGRSIEEGRQVVWTGRDTPWYLDNDDE
jgi:hypothetical protein